MFCRRVLLIAPTPGVVALNDSEAEGGTAQRVSCEARVPRGPAHSERSELQGGEGALRKGPA